MGVCLFLNIQAASSQSSVEDELVRPSYLRCLPNEQNEWNCQRYYEDTHEAAPSKLSDNAYDWVPTSLLSPAELESLLPGCAGVYRDPLKGREDEGDPSQLPLTVYADESQVLQNKTAKLQGNVQISQGSRSLSAEKVSYDLESDQVKLEEGVTIRQPGILIRGSSAYVLASGKDSTFNDALFVIHDTHLRGSAESIRQNERQIVLKDGRFTSCEPGSKAWSMEGEELVLDKESQQGTGKNIKIKVGNVPIFYLPYITFPLGDERKTGFLYPTISSSEDGSLDVVAPFYWNLAPNYDATITPSIISDRGIMLETQFRHLHPSFRTITDIAVLPNDQGGIDAGVDRVISSGQLSKSQVRPNEGKDRWLLHLDQFGSNQQSWYSKVDYTKVSDVDYFRDLDTNSFNESNTIYLNQSLEAGYDFRQWQISTLVQDNQLLLKNIDSPYKRVPQVDALGQFRFGQGTAKLAHRFTRFGHSQTTWLDGDPVITGNRLNMDYRFRWEQRSDWGFAIPEVGFKQIIYDLDAETIDRGKDSNPMAGAGQVSFDAGIILDNRGSEYLYTLEPRAFYIFRQFADQSDFLDISGGRDINFDSSERTFSYAQLYRDTRFAGGDRLDDTNQITVGLTLRSTSLSSGRERFTASIGQIVYLDDRRVSLFSSDNREQTSELAAEFNASVGPLTHAYTNIIYDDGNDEFRRISSGLSYHNEDYQQLANLSYHLVRAPLDEQDIDQADLSFLVPLAKQWHGVGRYYYDFTNEQELETFFGLEYNDCCYRIRLLARRWLDSNIASLITGVIDEKDISHNTGLFFEFHLKGLGGSGERLSNILADSIRGYTERERLNNQ